MRFGRRAFLGIAAILAGLSAAPVVAEGQVVNVVATTGMIADAARQVGGDRARSGR